MKHIKYKEGCKYQLVDDYEVEIDLDLPEGFKIAQYYIQLRHIAPKKALLEIFSGYAWDGASGPTWDDKKNMRASLVHDALYQLMRYGFLSQNCRKQVDMVFKNICAEDGMNFIRVAYYYFAVRRFAKNASLPRSKKKILSA